MSGMCHIFLFFLLSTILLETWTGHVPISVNTPKPELFQTERSPKAADVCKIKTTAIFDAHPLPTTCKNEMGVIYKIGIQVNLTIYNKLQVCFNPDHHTTYWTQHILKPSTGTCGFVKAKWGSNGFTGLDVDSLYGSVSSYADRAQLTPSCDFSDEDDRQATYFYLNSVPVYRGFLQGNWKELEQAVRDFVNSNNLKAKVTTGTIGVQCLVGTVWTQALSYPEQLFKIIAFEDGSARVFIGVNSDSDEFGHVCDAIPGSGWPDVTKGTIYECEITDKLLKILGVEPDAAIYDGPKVDII